MFKAGFACTITLLLILCCVFAEFWNICRQRKHVQEGKQKRKEKDTALGHRSDTKAPLIDVKS